jgi:hypothetical protein
MRMRLHLSAAVAAASALAALALVAGSAAAATPPAADQLLARSATALQKATSFHLDLEAHTTAKSDGSLTAAKLNKLVQPVDITAHGDLSPGAIAIAGKMGAGPQTLAAELRASGNELYINFLGTWYGTKDAKSSSSKGNGLTLNTNPKQLSAALAQLLGNGLDATAKEGPELDGVSTWSVTGTFEGAQLAKALKQAGLAVATKDVNSLAGITAVTVLIGRDDSLPRRLSLTSTLAGADLSKAKSTTGGLVPLPSSGTKGLKSVTVSLVVDLAKFGQKPAFERPASFKPIEAMFDALLGGLGGSGSSAGTKTTKTA